MIIFSWVRFLSKKITKPKFYFFIKKTETGSNRPVRFGFLGQKPVQIGLTQFFRFGSSLARFFPVWLGFFLFGSVFSGFFCDLGSVKFFQFQTYKTETKPNRSVFLKF